MELRCPACGKANDLAQPACQRCGCDLGMLSTVLHSAVDHLKAAAATLRSQDWEQAFEHAEKSWSFYHTPAAARLACLAAVALGDSEQVWRWLPRARHSRD